MCSLFSLEAYRIGKGRFLFFCFRLFPVGLKCDFWNECALFVRKTYRFIEIRVNLQIA